MQQMPVTRKSGETSKFVVVSLFGLLLGLTLVVFTLLAVFSFRLDLPTYLMYIFLLYLLAPIVPGLYIAQQRGDAREGLRAGRLTSITGIVLALLAALIWDIAQGPDRRFIPPPVILFWFAILNLAGFVVSLIGAFVGGHVGKAWRKRFSSQS